MAAILVNVEVGSDLRKKQKLVTTTMSASGRRISAGKGPFAPTPLALINAPVPKAIGLEKRN